jgi:hypothetical protein
MTYGRSRLILGMTAVGLVTFSAVMLSLTQAHTQGLPRANTERSIEFLFLLTVVSFWAALLLPFDFIGGYLLPKHFCRTVPDLPNFMLSWARGMIVQTALITSFLWCILQVGQVLGLVAAISLVVVTQLILLAFQKHVAASVAHLPMMSTKFDEEAGLVSGYAASGHTDSGFTGSIVGLPGFEEVVLPRSWHSKLAPDQLRAEIFRRLGAIRSGSRTRGVLLAIAMNTLTFTTCTFFPAAGVSTVSELISTSLYFTIFSFLWLLVLPTWSREGVFEADRFAYENGIPFKVIETAAETIEALHDDDPKRSRQLESIFHPVPCVRRRMAELSLRIRSIRGYWNVARLALFLSWPCGGFLSRAVHCNIGRPELWVLLPTD